jgi:hypothetical protein
VFVVQPHSHFSFSPDPLPDQMGDEHALVYESFGEAQVAAEIISLRKESNYVAWLTNIKNTNFVGDTIGQRDLLGLFLENSDNQVYCGPVPSYDFWRTLDTIDLSESEAILSELGCTTIPAEFVFEYMPKFKFNLFGHSDHHPIRFFNHFARYAQKYPLELVNSVTSDYLRAITMITYWTKEMHQELIRSMYYPFAEYLINFGENQETSTFFMWWDTLAYTDWMEEEGVLVVETLQKILYLPNEQCQISALHGLNHHCGDELRHQIIDEWIGEFNPSGKLLREAISYREGGCM